MPNPILKNDIAKLGALLDIAKEQFANNHVVILVTTPTGVDLVSDLDQPKAMALLKACIDNSHDAEDYQCH